MLRRPPSSTLFPYTTLSDLGGRGRLLAVRDAGRAIARQEQHQRARRSPAGRLQRLSQRAARRHLRRRQRSEEHTSELQSRRDLVCRLLLEKKKKRDIKGFDT